MVDDSLSKNLPVTNLKLKMAITGAITKDRTVAKSTSSLRLSLKLKYNHKRANSHITSKKKM